MWLLEFLFFALTLLLGWSVFGYFLVIFSMGLFQKRRTPEFPDSWPLISVVVPCYNEEQSIIEKLENVRALEYPRDRLEVVFADGASSDETVKLLTSEIKQDEPFRVVRCPTKGKINQLNYALPQLQGAIIVNTDTDARLKPDTLQWIASEFETSPDAWVVGAYCYPGDSLDIERYYWDAQNKGRFLESDARTCSIVIAQCYAFRRELLAAFPEDVVADDIYVAFLANTLGHRTLYSRHAMAEETRTPQGYAQFLPHKFRKSNAFLRETLRFVYRLPEMPSFCRMMLITRLLQQLLLPWTLIVWMLVAGSLLTLFRFDLVIFAVLFLVLLLLITNRVFAYVKLPSRQASHSLVTIINGFLITTALLLVAGLCYPFFRQGSSYARLDSISSEDEDENESSHPVSDK